MEQHFLFFRIIIRNLLLCEWDSQEFVLVAVHTLNRTFNKQHDDTIMCKQYNRLWKENICKSAIKWNVSLWTSHFFNSLLLDCTPKVWCCPLSGTLPNCSPLTPGQTQSHEEGVRHEAVEQVWDDQEVGLGLLLGGEGHHGLRQLRLGGAGMWWPV